MQKILTILKNIRWLGLLGTIGLVTGNGLWTLFFLFFLFSFVDTFRNLPIFLQSLYLLFGIPWIYLINGFNLPSKENYTPQTELILPFSSKWLVINGGTDKMTSHSWRIPTQRYAYDFFIVDKEGKTSSGDNKKVENYYCYGKDILAPADGEIVSFASHHPDSSVYGDGRAECKAHDIRGNHIIIRYSKKEYSLIAHLKPDSIKVRKGQKVKQGQVIAQCGNSGNTTEPHIHFQMNNGKNFFITAGLPIKFKNVVVIENEKTSATGYISKGQFAENGG
jgi:murein DD-endopeptidase MepM/ murein hydrolase activator NlpD